MCHAVFPHVFHFSPMNRQKGIGGKASVISSFVIKQFIQYGGPPAAVVCLFSNPRAMNIIPGLGSNINRPFSIGSTQ